MKKKYVTPEIEITEFEAEDIITKSNESVKIDPWDDAYTDKNY